MTLMARSTGSPPRGTPAQPIRESFLYESTPSLVPFSILGVRTPQMKYIRCPELGEAEDELYDLSADPEELKNRVGDPAYADELQSMRDELKRLAREIRGDA